MAYRKPDLLLYRMAQGVSRAISSHYFKCRVLRNEIRNAEGPFVVVANHECALDFVNLIGMTNRRMTFVISYSFYNSLPVTSVLEKLAVIPKQQFQTTVGNMKRMKNVVDAGEPLVIYPAGLMCEDGLPTPIPKGTYKILKWLGADVYAARTTGSYFVMPKWQSGMRTGRTYMDVYKLIDKEELSQMSEDEIREKVDKAILFDAYREQDELKESYKDNDKLEGLQNVLFRCPECGSEFTIQVRDGNTLHCTNCGYSATSDSYGMLKRSSSEGPDIRYVSDWSRHIYSRMKEDIISRRLQSLAAKTHIHMLDLKNHRFTEVGQGSISLNEEGFLLEGNVNGEEISRKFAISWFPTLPFSPGRFLELQHGNTIYRCVLDDGRLAMKFINMVKIFYELSSK